MSALAVRELAAAARRADTPALLDTLAALDVSPTNVIGDLEAGRARR